LNPGQGGPDDASTAAASDRFAAAPAAASPGGDTPDLVLEAGRAVDAETLAFRPGQHVHGPQGKRPSVVVRSAGLRVGVENVVFENLDFAWEPTDRTRSLPASKLALIDLEASRAEFHGCRFQAVASGASRPVAIRWIYPATHADSVLALPSGRVQLKDCVLRGVDGAVDCQTAGAMALEAGNMLYLGAGPCFRLGHCPAADEPVVLVLSRVTLRGSGPLLECCYDAVAESPGSISIRAQQCAVLPRPDTAILQWRGNEPPARMAENTRWIGQGTLVGPKTVIAVWQPPTGPVRVLDESAVAIEGVVRSEVAFAGAAEAEASASRIVRWQVPLRSPDPPGFNPDGLP
jgi:hypothetical protein